MCLAGLRLVGQGVRWITKEIACRADAEDDTLISTSAGFNTLHLILCDASLMKFVKFVSHSAPSSRWDLAAEFLTDLQPDEC